MTKIKTKPNHSLKRVEMRTVKATNFSTRSSDGGLQVSGYVNKTGQQSDPIPNFMDVPDDLPNSDSDTFVEVMKPGVFKDALANLDTADGFVDFYMEHDPDKYLASTKDGSMELSEDNTGLKMNATITPTSWGNDAYTLIKSGAIGGMSFGFVVLSDLWNVTGDVPVRTVNKMELFEVSAVRFPAYSNSSIEARNRIRKLNHTLEKRGLTLGKVMIPKGGKKMTKKQEKRANSGASNSTNTQNLADGVNANTAAINNLNQSVQEQSEVLNDAVTKLLQGANERSKEPIQKVEKRSDNKKSTKKSKEANKAGNPKDEKRSKEPVKDGKRPTSKPKKDVKKSEKRGKDVDIGEKADKMMSDFAKMQANDPKK